MERDRSKFQLLLVLVPTPACHKSTRLHRSATSKSALGHCFRTVSTVADSSNVGIINLVFGHTANCLKRTKGFEMELTTDYLETIGVEEQRYHRRSRAVLSSIRPTLIFQNPRKSPFMPWSEALLIWPRIISPSKGRNTIKRNSTGDSLNICSFLADSAHH